MNACNQMLPALSTVTMFRRIKSRKNVSSYNKKSQVTASVVHQTNNLSQPTPPDHIIESVLEEIVQKHCFGVKYDPVKCVSRVKIIAGEVMHRIKNFQFDRYRLIVYVQIGEKQNQEFETAVKFLWDSSKDKFITYNLTSGSMFTTVTCFGIYLD